MIVTVEISYYPLAEEFAAPINTFLKMLKHEDLKVEVGTMSTLITGEYNLVMNHITRAMGELMEKHASVFTIKISNSCSIQ